jgi:adenylate cyclase
VRTLTRAELASEADVDPLLVDELIRMGALRPADDGSFSSGDIVRVQTVKSGIDAGISLENLERTLAERLQTLDYIDQFYLDPAPRADRTYADFRASLGDAAADLSTVYAAFGLPEPALDSRLRTDEEEVVRAFLDGWGAFGNREMLMRAARIHGEGIRRIMESVVSLYFEKVSAPLSEQGLDLDELVRQTVEPATKIIRLEPELLVWLEQRHLEHSVNALNFDELERTLVDRGWADRRPDEPPAVAFVDLSGFTDTTERSGDEAASRLAARLQDLADASAHRYRGRVVKLLGDGVMFRFESAPDAISAVLAMVEAAPAAGLPPAHAGVAAGPLIEREGDYYGRTVNLAARIADLAAPGDVLVSAAARATSADGVFNFEPLEAAVLKGIADPVPLFRASRARAPRTPRTA